MPFNPQALSPETFIGLGTGLLSGGTWNEQLANAGTGALNAINAEKAKQTQQLQLKTTADFLQDKDPNLAAMVRNGAMQPADAYKQFLSAQAEKAKQSQPDYQFQQLPDGTYGNWDKRTGQFNQLGKYEKPQDLPSVAEEYNFAKQNGFQGSFMDYQKSKATMTGNGQNEYGLTPIWVQDPKTGQQRLMVTSKDGSTKFLDTQGTNPISPLKAIDTGTGTMLVDPRTAQQNTTIQKDISGAEEQKLAAKNKTDAQAQLATVKQMASQIDEQVKALIGDPEKARPRDSGLNKVVGPFDAGWGGWLPNFTEDANRAQTKIDYLKGTAFVQGREFLKGQGQITDFESRKAEAAFSRMNQAQGEADFIKAVQDFNDAVQAGVQKVEAAAKGQWNPSEVPNVTTTPNGVNTTSTGIKWKVPGQ